MVLSAMACCTPKVAFASHYGKDTPSCFYSSLPLQWLVLMLLLPPPRLHPMALPQGLNAVCAVVFLATSIFLHPANIDTCVAGPIVCIHLLVSFLEREQTHLALHI